VPVLRFTRDPRGYESTYLVEAARKGSQTSGSLLYWFRTPPHVKVGRAAFDEDAIRLLEQQHPDIDFDWDRILTARPAAAPEPREGRGGRPERRGPREGRREDVRGRETAPVERRERVAVPSIPVAAPAVEPPAPVPAILESLVPTPVPPPVAVPPEPSAPVRRFVRVFDLPAEPAPEHHASDPSAAERRLGPEQLTMLRARYAEILACITARGGDPARIDALREQAERANPDAWVTDAEVVTGLAAVDGVLAELHQQVGRRRRRRRRGGRGRRPDTGTEATLAQTESDAAGPPTDEADLDVEEDGSPE
jgi:hypothetical protein